MPLVRYVRALPSRSNSNRTQLTVDRHIVSVHRFFDVPKQLRRRTPCAGTSNPSALASRSCRCLSRPFREVDFTTLRPTFAVPVSPSLLPLPRCSCGRCVFTNVLLEHKTVLLVFVVRSSFFVLCVRCSVFASQCSHCCWESTSLTHSPTDHRPPHRTGPDRVTERILQSQNSRYCIM